MQNFPELKIEYMDLNEIKPYKRNVKKHPDWQVAQIEESIKQFGFNDPVAVDEKNEIIEGHGRVMAAKQLGYEQLPVIRLDYLDEDAKRAYILVHNKLTMNTKFDIEMLKQEISEIRDIDLGDFGFDFPDLDFTADSVIDDLDSALGEASALPGNASKLGEIFKVNGNYMFCGNFSELSALEQLAQTGNANIIFGDCKDERAFVPNKAKKVAEIAPAVDGLIEDWCPNTSGGIVKE